MGRQVFGRQIKAGIGGWKLGQRNRKQWSRSMREGDEFFNPGKQWKDKVVVCLGSGYSLRRLEEEEWRAIEKLQGKGNIVIAVNSSIKTARELGKIEPDVLLFTDLNWYEANEQLIKEFVGQIWTFSRRAKVAYRHLLRIENIHQDNFGRVGEPPLRDGRSSGHRAVSLGVLCGAKKVVMLGYDMQVDPESGRSHCHDDYKNTENQKSYAQEFVPGFHRWYADGLEVGCRIVNCTSTTALMEFPREKLLDEIAEDL